MAKSLRDVGDPPLMKEGWEDVLDGVFEKMCDNPICAIPGLVVLARRGSHVYHKSFGLADVESGKKMEMDAQFRIFSMTKVLASATALALIDQGADLAEDRPVSDFIPSFGREWTVVSEPPTGSHPAHTVQYETFLTGQKVDIGYNTAPSTRTMLVRHLMGESSGIGYDQWTDVDVWLGNGLGMQYGAAQALRRKAGNGFYSSNCIVGQDVSLADYCDAMAEAGVLVCEPGTFSYGLGALVLGRVIEVAYERLHGRPARFADIVAEILFKPLGMESAAFYLGDGDPRVAKIPTLYGGVLRDPHDLSGACGCDARRYEDCLPPTSVPNTVATDHYSGPRKCDSGDTGATMTVADYAKFYELLLAHGVTPNGVRVLSEKSVRTLTHGSGMHADGVDAREGGDAGHPDDSSGSGAGAGTAKDVLDSASTSSSDSGVGTGGVNAVAKLMGLEEGNPIGQTFEHGWAQVPRSVQGGEGRPHCNYWSGYANNHGRLYCEDESYILVFPQFMGSSPGGWLLGGKTVREKAKQAFESVWEVPYSMR